MKVIRWIALTVGAVLIGLLVTSLFNNISSSIKNNEDRDLKRVYPTFSVGGIDSDGKLTEDTDSIVTKTPLHVSKIKIELDFTSRVNYQLFYYDKDDNLKHTTDICSVTSTVEQSNAHYVRIVVYPTFDSGDENEDEVIKWHEVLKYSNQIKVKVKTTDFVWSFDLVDESQATITNVRYTEDMTWAEWIKVNNVTSFEVKDGYVVYNGTKHLHIGDTLVRGTDVINSINRYVVKAKATE